MKHLIYGISMSLIVILVVVAVVTLEQNALRENELDNAIDYAMNQSMKQAYYGNGSVYNDDLLKNSFENYLYECINKGNDDDSDPNQSISVNITECDYKKGILSAIVCENFTTATGRVKSIKVAKTMVLEQSENEEFFNVNYYEIVDNEERLITSIRQRGGSDIRIPQALKADNGHRFVLKEDLGKLKSGTSLTSETLAGEVVNDDVNIIVSQNIVS